MALLLMDNAISEYTQSLTMYSKGKNALWCAASIIHYIAIRQLILELDPSIYETTIWITHVTNLVFI